MPRVSIVIPVYNPGAFLGPCLASVLRQTMEDLEVVVVDDGSTEDISQLPALGDSRVRTIRQSNEGVAVARNVGVLAAESPFVAFLDHDDTWHPEKLALQLVELERFPDTSLCHSGFEWVWPDRRVQAPVTEEVTYAGLLSTQMICTSTALVRRDRLIGVGGFNPLLRAAEDFDVFLRLAMTGAPIKAAEQVLVSYNYHGSNASRDYMAGFIGRRRVIEQHLDRARSLDDQEIVAACRRGLKRTVEIYGPQAVDALREDLHQHRYSALPARVADVARIDPGELFVATLRSVQARAAELWKRSATTEAAISRD